MEGSVHHVDPVGAVAAAAAIHIIDSVARGGLKRARRLLKEDRVEAGLTRGVGVDNARLRIPWIHDGAGSAFTGGHIGPGGHAAGLELIGAGVGVTGIVVALVRGRIVCLAIGTGDPRCECVDTSRIIAVHDEEIGASLKIHVETCIVAVTGVVIAGDLGGCSPALSAQIEHRIEPLRVKDDVPRPADSEKIDHLFATYAINTGWAGVVPPARGGVGNLFSCEGQRQGIVAGLTRGRRQTGTLAVVRVPLITEADRA